MQAIRYRERAGGLASSDRTMWTADHFIRDLQQLLYADLGPARMAARDIAGDLAISSSIVSGPPPTATSASPKSPNACSRFATTDTRYPQTERVAENRAPPPE